MSNNTSKSFSIAVAVAILLVLGIWWQMNRAGGPSLTPSGSGQPSSAVGSDDTSAISQDLNSVDLGSVDAEFQNIDRDLNSL